MSDNDKLKRFEKHLITCPHCGKDVLDHMQVCPFCKGEIEGSGYGRMDEIKRRKIRKILGIVFVVLAVLIYLMKIIVN